MYHEIAENMTTRFLEITGETEGKEVYVYGAELLISSLVEIVIVLAMSIFFGYFLETVIFLLFFCTLRSKAGGIHAPNYLLCTLIFSSIYLIFCLWLRPIKLIYQVIFIACSSVAIFVLAPVEDRNKKLGEKRKKRLKTSSRLICIAEIIVYVLMLMSGVSRQISTMISLSFLTAGVFVLLGHLKNKLEDRRLLLSGEK